VVSKVLVFLIVFVTCGLAVVVRYGGGGMILSPTTVLILAGVSGLLVGVWAWRNDGR
jgi:hypothetical protein